MKASRAPQPAAVSVATQNACTVCMPLGACLAFRGVAGAAPFLHGPQGCATYIRRFLIGHFREPMDIACSSFNEESAIFGGGRDLHRGLDNVARQYQPALIGIATTCLAETIGDDVPMLLRQYRQERGETAPKLAWVSTPSYHGAHTDGFHAAVRSMVEQLAGDGPSPEPEEAAGVNILGNMLSPADLRYLHEILEDFGAPYTLLPDYSETLDRPVLLDYERIARGGTSIASIARMAHAPATIQLSATVPPEYDAGRYLADRFDVPEHRLGIPIGIRETDRFLGILESVTGRSVPAKHHQERGRLIDAYVDSHKYLFGKRIGIVGEADLVIGLASLISELGARPVLCASGDRGSRFEPALRAVLSESALPEVIVADADFSIIERSFDETPVDLLLGSSRCAPMAARRNVPLLRVGMPVHDRVGAQRILHIGYRGAQGLLDALANTFIQLEQESGDAGYMTM